jgi:hypothetical protein
MVWYYEILGKDDVVLETSEPVYGTLANPVAEVTVRPVS